MPIRKIPKNHLVVTGSFASCKNDQMDAFESLLEKEYMLLLEFDERVLRFEPQPVTIAVPGIPKGYVPDVLVHYHPDPISGKIPKSLLTEVKHTDDLQRNAQKYAPKFALAEEYASECGWEFRITTQVDIRTPLLANLKFLREYRNIEPANQDSLGLIQIVRGNGGLSSVESLLERLAVTDDDRLHWLPIIWHAVVTRGLLTDWDQPINNDTVLQLPEDVI
ncbi:TnsA endonuclease N-terminal domain-containing protein [Undibacterium sp. Dicai25W]|uniref:TnsA endonuclease N-terminal domain-containing protein n=1 Tax=Undibacterium sp. Dicai25W TaxID=3413034 RepID=UPI003BF0A5B4